MKNTIKYGLILLILGSIGGIIYYKMASKKRDPSKSNDIVYIKANDLFKLFNEYEDSANKLYLDKAINIQGEILSIENNPPRYTLYINTNDSNGNISCELDSSQNQIAKNLAPKQLVNITGFCNGKLIDVQLDKCVIGK